MISNFQFTSPVLTNLDFKINESFNEDNEIKISVRVETNVSKNTSKPEAIVRVNVLIGSSDVSMPFYLKADEMANFFWDEGEYTDVEVDKLLTQNAPALLIGYLRPIVASVTNSSPTKAYDIPFISFAQKAE